MPVKTPVINQISDVVYEQVPMRGYPNVAMKMDILQPKSAAKLPAIVYVTGGGFINANKDNGIQLRMHLAEAGYVVASIQYRVAPTARFPEPLEDVKASIRYLKAMQTNSASTRNESASSAAVPAAISRRWRRRRAARRPLTRAIISKSAAT